LKPALPYAVFAFVCSSESQNIRLKENDLRCGGKLIEPQPERARKAQFAVVRCIQRGYWRLTAKNPFALTVKAA